MVTVQPERESTVGAFANGRVLNCYSIHASAGTFRDQT